MREKVVYSAIFKIVISIKLISWQSVLQAEMIVLLRLIVCSGEPLGITITCNNTSDTVSTSTSYTHSDTMSIQNRKNTVIFYDTIHRAVCYRSFWWAEFFYLYNNRANPLLYVSRALGSDFPHFVPEARKTSPWSSVSSTVLVRALLTALRIITGFIDRYTHYSHLHLWINLLNGTVMLPSHGMNDGSKEASCLSDKWTASY